MFKTPILRLKSNSEHDKNIADSFKINADGSFKVECTFVLQDGSRIRGTLTAIGR